MIDLARHIQALGVLTFGMLAIACAQGSTGQSGSESGPPSGANTSSATVGGTGSMTASGSTTSSSGVGGAGGMTNTSSAAAGNGGSTASSGSGGAGGGSPCDPAPSDTACQTCVKTNCCPEWEACQPDPICTCWVDCFLAGGSSSMCTQLCGAVDPVTTNLNMCRQNAACACP